MTDIRTVKTTNAIRQAFTEMIIKNNEKVYFSIKEIADKANINRKTFYLHFECIEDLYKDLEDITENKIIEVLEKNGFFEENFSLKTFLTSIIEFINTDKPLYEKLLVSDNYKFVFRNIKNKIKLKIVPMLKTDSDLKTELYTEFLCAGLLKVFRVWATRKDQVNQEEFLEYTYSIIKYGMHGLDK